MMRNYLHIAFRHLGRQKLNTALHITGLTLGITVCLLITLFIRYEMSFDTYHEKANRTYRVASKWTEPNNQIDRNFSTPFPLANAIRNEISGIEHVSFAHPPYVQTVEVTPKKRFLQKNILVVEPDFPNIFQIEVLKGDIYQTLSKPYQAALTESTAKKFYGNEDPIGKTFKFKIREDFEFTVTALIKDFPSNTHLPASILLSHSYTENFLKPNLDGWTYVSGTETLVVLPENADLSIVSAQLKAIADKYINPKISKLNERTDFELQPLNDVHFNASYANGSRWVQAVSISWLWFFGIIGIAVLILACINFMNLSTAQALTRAKEVGVRKSVGAAKRSLIMQFLLEAWVLIFVSGILAVAATQMLLPYLNTLMNKSITFNLLESPVLLALLLVGLVVTGLLSGIYPAWVITKFNPSITLKAGVVSTGSQGSAWLRKSLVVVQFSLSACLLMAVMLMAQQVSFLRNKKLGFDKDNVVVVDVKNSEKTSRIFANELRKIKGVKDFTFETSTPSSQGHWGTIMSRENVFDNNRKSVTTIFADDKYCGLYNLKLVTGRLLQAADTNFISASLPKEKRMMKAVVNEKLVRELEFESNEAAIGQVVNVGVNTGKIEIVGVIANFDSGPLREVITPVFITPNLEECEQAGIKIEAKSHLPETIAAIEAAWKVAYPEGAFSYQFLDEQIDGYYKSEERLFTLFKIFSGLAMFISCLGLFGLVAYTTQARTKEIGIRKVLGATVNGIVVLLSKDFLKLVLIALAIATPFAWYGIYQWLQGYAYHIEITWTSFALSGLAAMVITLVTVSAHAIKAAVSNPTESLRSE
jgi:ABC-type antimicrobial peptide transport system permease subunit